MNSSNTKIVKVLLVDDVQMHRFTMKYGMEIVNPTIKIDEAENLAQAIEKLSSNDYSAVISDWSMPGGGGEELVSWMRARPQFNSVAFVMISAKSNNKDIIQAFTEHKVDDYVVKPFRRKALVEKTMAAIEKRRQGTA
jgi:DNA-binding response OmpR family regulator